MSLAGLLREHRKPDAKPKANLEAEASWWQTKDRVAEMDAKPAIGAPDREAADKTAHHKRPNASISLDDQQVSIVNRDTFSWPEMNIHINGDPPFGYRIRIHELKSGGSITIPLNRFTKSNGERFNPNSYSVVKLWIGGKDYNYVAFGSL